MIYVTISSTKIKRVINANYIQQIIPLPGNNGCIIQFQEGGKIPVKETMDDLYKKLTVTRFFLKEDTIVPV